MKILKYILLTIFITVLFALAAIVYDLAYYDTSYVNRNSLTFSKQNLNKKKIGFTTSTIKK